MFALKRNQVIITALVAMIAVAGYLNYIDNPNAMQNEILLNDQGEVMALVPNASNESVPVNAVSNTANKQVQKSIGDALTFEDNPEILMNNQVAADANDGTKVVGVVGIISNTDNETASINDVATADEVSANNENQTNVAVQDETIQNANNTPDGTAVFVNNSNDSSYFVQAKLEREQSRAKQKDMLTEMINNDSIDKEKKSEVADEMLSIQKRIEKETASEAMIEAKGFKEVYVRIDDDTVDVVVNKEKLTEAETAQITDIVKRKTGMDASQIRISTIKK